MPFETATILACVGAVVGLAGWGLALYNARKAVRWKRAELASNYLKELNSNSVLVFACRGLEWYGGRLVVPEYLRPLLPSKLDCIEHDPTLLRQAMTPGLCLHEMAAEPRLQLYRTAVDDLLSWLGLVASALDRNLFQPEDVPDVGYWVLQIDKSGYMEDFICGFVYSRTMKKLRRAFAKINNDHRDGRALNVTRGDLGSNEKWRIPWHKAIF